MRSWPYRSIAVASTFSPRFLQVLAEAKRLRDRFDADLSVIYAGAPDPESATKFTDAMARLSLPLDSMIHYRSGEPATVIMDIVRTNEIDLIVAGALEKEVVLRPFLGNVARRIVREAACSVILFIKPESEPKPLRRIVFITDFSEHAHAALKKTLHLAEAEGTERLYVIRVYTTFDEARASLHHSGTVTADQPAARTIEEEEAAIDEFIQAAGATPVPMESRCIRGNTGFAVSDFVQTIEADLLVIPAAPNDDPNAALPGHMDWVKDVIPCNLWVIR